MVKNDTNSKRVYQKYRYSAFLYKVFAPIPDSVRISFNLRLTCGAQSDQTKDKRLKVKTSRVSVDDQFGNDFIQYTALV